MVEGKVEGAKIGAHKLDCTFACVFSSFSYISQHSFMLNLFKAGIAENFLNLIKGVYQKSIGNILRGEMPTTVLLKS